MSPGRVTTAFERLEPCAVKAASTVLRGRGGSNVALLPDWTSSLHKDYPYRLDDSRERPGMSAARVVRGGSFVDVAKFVRCACRASNSPVDRSHNRGFRVVLQAA